MNLIDNPRIKSVPGLDASFLYAENPRSPMHVGSVAVIEGSLQFETFRATLLSRLHQLPTLRQRLMFVPMSIDNPYWVDDPNFNIDLHLQHVALPQPGDWQQLRKMASSIFSEPLDRSRPLWEFTFVEGLDSINQVPKGSVAIISKIHHAAIDGMAGAGMMSLIFDMSAKPKELSPPRPWKPGPLPHEINLMLKSAMSFAKNPLKLPKIVASTVTATVKSGVVNRIQSVELPTAPFTAPNTPLNGIISPQRKWGTAVLDFSRVRKIKSVMGTTLNDVVLAICAGALRRYLHEKGKLPNKPLVAMVPISTRDQQEQEKTNGNRLSAMLVQLATNIEDPIERLEAIHENTIRGKTYQGAIGAKSLSNLAEVVPFGVANQAARLYSRFNVAKMHNPVFNVVITNVPGPQMPIYLHGHKLHSVMGMAPIIDGMGLIITVLSYNGSITISPTSDAKSMPDINTFATYIRESANELEELTLALEAQGKKPKKKPAPQSDKVMLHIKDYLKKNPEFLKPNAGIYQIQIEGKAEAIWQLNFSEPPGVVRRGKAKEPDLVLTVRDEHMLRIGTGDLDFQTAFIQGRLNVKGDMKKAMKLAKILSLIPKLELEKA
ncbi:MAG: wax ester/triacylglycerol synthase family O-acyltransferase [Bacteroidota bacterium]